jgi:quinol---cytochrome c reductase iron-sulfur subunit, bacillus type
VVETKGPSGPAHEPGPTLWPLGLAIGLTVALVGLVIGSWVSVAVGAALVVAFGFLWIRDVTSGLAAAPPTEGEAALGGPESATDATPVPAQVGGDALPVMSDEEIASYPRSKFIEASTLGLGAVIGGLVTVPAVGLMVAPAFVKQGKKPVDLGPYTDFPEGEFAIATFLTSPEEGEVSRRTAYVRNNGLKDGVPSFTIVSNRCVHLGCPVQVNGLAIENQKKMIKVEDGPAVELTPTQAASGFGCPCHGGQYDTEGNRTAGPPVRALDRYSYGIIDGRLVLLDTYSVGEVDGEGADAKIKKYALANPGDHVEGPEAWFYPVNAPH